MEKEIQINEDLSVLEWDCADEIQINLFDEYTHLSIEQAKKLAKFLNDQLHKK